MSNVKINGDVIANNFIGTATNASALGSWVTENSKKSETLESTGYFILAKITAADGQRTNPMHFIGVLGNQYYYFYSTQTTFEIVGNNYSGGSRVHVLSKNCIDGISLQFNQLLIVKVDDNTYYLVGYRYYPAQNAHWLSLLNLNQQSWKIESMPFTIWDGTGDVVSTVYLDNTPNGMQYYGTSAPNGTPYTEEGTIFYKIL